MRNPFSARFAKKEDSEVILRESNQGDVIIAHSYGTLKALEAAEQKPYKALFLLGAAAPRDYDFSEILYRGTKVYNWYSRNDWVVRAGALMLFHPFGLAGVKGFSQPEVVNFEEGGGHNDYFKGANIPRIAQSINCILTKGYRNE